MKKSGEVWEETLPDFLCDRVEICKKGLLCRNQFQGVIQTVQNGECGVVNFGESYNVVAEIIGAGVFDVCAVYDHMSWFSSRFKTSSSDS